MYPDPPLEAVPEVNLNAPLTPEIPAFNVLTINAPLEVGSPSPVDTLIAPPVPVDAAVDKPAVITMSPPV